MRILQIIIVLSIILFSCNNEKKNNTATNESSEVSNTEVIIDSEELKYPYNLHSIWAFDCMKDTVLQIHIVDRDTLSPDLLVNLLNLDFKDKVYCEFIGINKDTAFVRVPDSEYLTQSMGTTGAYEYMIAATFTITELEGIEFVNFDFEFGDHAMPGTYSRQHYLDEIEYNKSLNR